MHPGDLGGQEKDSPGVATPSAAAQLVTLRGLLLEVRSFLPSVDAGSQQFILNNALCSRRSMIRQREIFHAQGVVLIRMIHNQHRMVPAIRSLKAGLMRVVMPFGGGRAQP